MSYKQALKLIKKEKHEKTGTLYLYNLKLTKVPQSIKELTHLQSLSLNNNKISNISFLGNLSNLQSLHLNGNQISDISFLENLNNIESLSLSLNKIIDISFLANLSNLQSLYLDRNQISDVNFLKNLTNLQTLNLSENQISDISFLSNLSNLQTLDLRVNQISDIRFLSNLSNLQYLHLRENQISDYSFLSNLSNLQSLDLSRNEISDIRFLSRLSNLQTLEIYSNQISDISPLLPLIRKNMEVSIGEYLPEGINLQNNPVSTPPIETVKQGREAILRHFERLENADKKDTLYEAKVLIVGRTDAGKTSLRYKLKDPDKAMPEPDESTSGVDIEAITFKMENGQDFRMNVWDFEGQIISHQTHQFFLTKRSMYIFVADHRTEKVDTDYWFQIVELLSEGSPMCIFHNEKEGGIARLNTEAIQERFGSFLKEKSYRADLEAIGQGDKFKEKARADFQDFFNDLKTDLQQVEIVGIELEKSWVDIRGIIEELAVEKAIIDDKDLWKICTKNGVEKPIDQKDLSQLFHDLGIFLHFQETEKPSVLNKIIILQNNWATKAVYKILKSEWLEKEKLGHFKLSDLDKVWEQKAADDFDYRPYAGELVELMMKFKICYEVAKTKTYIAPQLLPPSPPSNYDFPIGEVMQLRYTYDFMPKGIITRLTVEMHEHIAREQTLAWKDGFVLEHSGATAEVVETYGKREIHIKTTGENRRLLINLVRFAMDKINDEYHFNEKIKAYKMLPCNCVKCIGTKNPYFHNYTRLVNVKKKGRNETDCESGEYADVNAMLSIILEGDESDSFEMQRILTGLNELKQGQKVIITNQQQAENMLTQILEFATTHQEALLQINQKIEDTDSANLTKLETMIEGKMNELVKEIPQTDDIVKKWKEVNSKSMLNVDSKLKAKLKFDLFFIAIEKEVAIDAKPSFKALLKLMKQTKQDFIAWSNNEKTFTELFVEEV